MLVLIIPRSFCYHKANENEGEIVMEKKMLIKEIVRMLKESNDISLLRTIYLILLKS